MPSEALDRLELALLDVVHRTAPLGVACPTCRALSGVPCDTGASHERRIALAAAWDAVTAFIRLLEADTGADVRQRPDGGGWELGLTPAGDEAAYRRGDEAAMRNVAQRLGLTSLLRPHADDSPRAVDTALERLADAVLQGRLRLTPDHIDHPGQQPSTLVWIADDPLTERTPDA